MKNTNGQRIAVYAGTFDPPTLGHIDVLHRASRLFDKVIIAVAESSSKNTLFTVEERLSLISVSVDLPNIETDSFSGLLVDFAASRNACALIRGLRAISDFEYEFQMALTNQKLKGEIETVFLMPSEKYSYVSSTLVKEIARFGGDVSAFVSPGTEELLKKKLLV
jgi:pantetheine-phosphate adenylyltransferase